MGGAEAQRRKYEESYHKEQQESAKWMTPLDSAAGLSGCGSSIF